MKTMNIAEMLEVAKDVELNSEVKDMKKVTELRQLVSFLYQEYLKLSHQKEEVDNLSGKSGEEMSNDGYATSLLYAEEYVPEGHEEHTPAKKAEHKEKVMKKDALVFEVHSKEQFVNVVQKAMNEGTILTPQGKPSGVNCVVSEKGLQIIVEFTVAKKENQGIIVRYYLPENFKASDFVKHFAVMMTKNAELMKRSVFNMSVSPCIYDTLKKQVIPAKELAMKGKSGLPIIIKTVEGKTVMMLKNDVKHNDEILVSVTKS